MLIKVQILKYYGQFGSILEDFLIFKPYIHSFLIISPLKQNLLLICVNLKTLPQRCFVPNLIEVPENIFNTPNHVFTLSLLSPL